MKYFLISLAVMAVAFAGILSQNGQANKIAVGSVAPALAWGGFLLVKAGAGFLADRRAKKALRK